MYGKIQNINLEELINWTGPRIHGAVRTRGILFAGPRPQSPQQGTSGPGTLARQYALTLPTDRPLPTGMGGGGFAIQPGVLVQEQFEFEVDASNLREIEVVGTFEAPVGSDRGVQGGGFWFWAYALDPSRPSRAASRTGLLTVEETALS